MKNFFPLLLIIGVLFFSSCGNGSNDPLPVVSPADSSTTGSYVTTWFDGEGFVMKDLALNGVSKIQLHASDVYDATDSLWICKIELIDAFKNQLEKDTGQEQEGERYLQSNSSRSVLARRCMRTANPSS